MTQYIDKAALLAEIKRRYKLVDKYETNEFCAVASRDELVHLMNFIRTLEVKEVDFWHKQSEEDIDDAINDWRVYSFLCIMKDGTTQKFTAVMGESYDGSINTHLDCVDDNYDWEYEDIIYWIEIPNIKAQKG
jgi:hypothetical protein